MKKIHKCSECGNDLPKDWRPVATRTCEAVCPTCALKHMKQKSERRKTLSRMRAVPETAE